MSNWYAIKRMIDSCFRSSISGKGPPIRNNSCPRLQLRAHVCDSANLLVTSSDCRWVQYTEMNVDVQKWPNNMVGDGRRFGRFLVPARKRYEMVPLGKCKPVKHEQTVRVHCRVALFNMLKALSFQNITSNIQVSDHVGPWDLRTDHGCLRKRWPLMIEWRCLTKKKNPVSTYFDCVFNMSSYFLILVKRKNTNLESEKRIIDNHSNHAICTSTYFGGTNTIQCIMGAWSSSRFATAKLFWTKRQDNELADSSTLPEGSPWLSPGHQILDV